MKGPEHANKGPDKKASPMPVFTKKENATLAQRIEILDWYHANGENQSKTVKHFDAIYPNLRIKQPLVSAWLKEEEKWQEEWACNGARTAKRTRQTQHPEVTEMMDLWVSNAMTDNILLTGEVLRQKWTRFADLVGVPMDERLNLSDGWLARFKVRNGLKEFKQHGEAASVSLETAEKEWQRIRELVEKDGVELRDLFNTDEMGLFYGQAPLFLIQVRSH
jgi:Tc5 transposase DNA-binding domain